MKANEFIEIRPDIMLGKPVIKGTRIPVELIIRKLGEGGTIEDLIDGYPSLRSEDLVNAWAYFRTHRDEIEQQIRKNEEA